MTVRNARLAAGAVINPNVYQVVYTVPANSAAIIKYVAIHNGSGTSLTGQAIIWEPQVAQAVLISGSIAANTTLAWSGWTVLNAGDEVAINTSVAGPYFWVAGAQLPYATP